MRRSSGMSLATSLIAGVLLVGSLAGLTACSSAEKKIGEFAIRNTAAVAGSAEFSNKGYPLEKRLSCTATLDTNNEKATVACTGTTKDGKAATLDGQADNKKDLKGSFVGKVDGTEVFSENCLGSNC